MDYFFLALGILFTVYALDLLFLVVVSAFARRHEERSGVSMTRPEHPGIKYKAPDTPTWASHKERISLAASNDVDKIKDAVKSDGYGDSTRWPMVLIQLPMYNEEACCDLIIERVSRILYPRDRLLIQVLDDSTKEHVRAKVDAAAAVAIEGGHPVQVLRRTNRGGYKAGAMVEGLEYVKDRGFQFAAIFDADFEPPEDFLYQTIHHLIREPELGYVQTRWTFSNVTSFLTWSQAVNLNFHFAVEQRARSYLGWFFNFNGTAGVWRIEAIEKSGGWSSDTVVEDMDLSLRCYLNGYSAIYLHHVHNWNELPSTLSAYKTQQFRWLSGPMQILSKCFWMVLTAKNLPFNRRMNCLWFFFRYILFGIITIAVLCVPPWIIFMSNWTWTWEQIYFTIAINFALAVYMYMTPLSPLYMLFSIAMGYFKAWAMLAGLLKLKKSMSWKVTTKLGKTKRAIQYHWPYAIEMILALYYAGFGFLAYRTDNWFMVAYCGIMSLSFLVVSFGDYFL